MHPIGIVVFVSAGAIGALCAVVLIEVVVGVVAGVIGGRSEGGRRVAACVIVPAHDEAGTVGETVRHLLGVLREGDEVVVVADNCSDSTADEARDAGARVVERLDEERRGKGYALAHGVAHSGDAPVVVVIDADCRTTQASLDAIVTRAARTGRPAQAVYEMGLPSEARVGDRVSAFAFAVKNRVRARGLHAVAGVSHLTGSGMAFPRALVEGDVLASGDIVEDMRLGIEMAGRGAAPGLCPGALVTSELPGTDDARRSQRTRWEHGHLATLVACGPRAVLGGLARLRFGQAALGVDLMVPPLSLLALVVVGLAAGAGIVGVALRDWSVGVVGAVPLVVLALAVGIAWATTGRRFLPARMVPGVAVYAVAKVPMYARALVSRQTAWVRTSREG